MFAAFPSDGDESNFEENGYATQTSAEMITQVINDHLGDYNDSHPVMKYVLFKYAIEHVVRISRGIPAANSHMLLVGFGGSGKQSLTRFAAFLVRF
jgi:dynein heavy chain